MQLLAKRILIASAFVVAALLPAAPIAAHEFETETLKIGHPWLRVPPPGATVAAAYLKLTNKSAEADRLLSVALPVAEKVELHTMTMEEGVMKMRPLPDGVAVPAGETVELKPGGMHVMLIGLTVPIVAGGKAKGTLRFEKAGAVEVEFVMQAMKDAADDHGAHHRAH